MSRGSWPAPAKINLFLHVLGRRADGYHDLQTLFQFLDLCDELTFAPNREGRIRRVGSDVDWPEDRDLAVRAARLLREAAHARQGVDIAIRKRIPPGGGLGGGSSDAATTLVALDRLWDLRVGVERLAELGRQLGADVPVFVRGRAAWAEGVGERLVPVLLEEPHYVVVTPPCRVSTAEIFHARALTRNRAPLKMSDFPFGGRPENADAPSIPALLEGSANDCEEVTRRRYPMVGPGSRVPFPFRSASDDGNRRIGVHAARKQGGRREILDGIASQVAGFRLSGPQSFASHHSRGRGMNYAERERGCPTPEARMPLRGAKGIDNAPAPRAELHGRPSPGV